MRERFHRSSRWVLAGLGALLLAGCGPAAPPPAASMQPPQEVLRQRAEARWARLIAHDLAGAYAFETPAYRGTVDLDQFKSQFGTAVRWIEVTVDQVKIDPAGDRAAVEVSLQLESQVPLVPYPVYSIQPLLEHWILTQGEWWLARDAADPGAEQAPDDAAPPTNP